MEEKLFNPVLTATPGKPAGKQQSMFKSTQGKANCLVFNCNKSCIQTLYQMYDIVCCTVTLLLGLNCTISQVFEWNRIYCV